MENLSANSSVSYMELGDNNTLREATTPNPEAINNTDETAPRERDAGSITSANFDPENLRQLSSTRLEPEVVPTEVPPRTPSHTTVNPTTQLSPDELSPLTSRLMNDTPTDLVTLMLKISSDIQDSYEKLGSRMDSRMEKMDRKLREHMKRICSRMEEMNNQIGKMDGGLREETRDIMGEMKDKRKQLDDTIVCPNQRVDDMQMNLRKEPENLEKQTKTDIQQAVEKQKTECVTTYQNLEKLIRDSTQPLEKSVQEVDTQLSLTDTSPNTASNTDKDNNPPPSTNIPSKTNGKSSNPSGKNSSGDHHARLGGEKTYKTLTVQIPAAQSKVKRQLSKINRKVYLNSNFHRKHARYKKPTAFEHYACFHPRHIRFKPALKPRDCKKHAQYKKSTAFEHSACFHPRHTRFKPAIKSRDCKIWTPKPNLS